MSEDEVVVPTRASSAARSKVSGNGVSEVEPEVKNEDEEPKPNTPTGLFGK